MVVCLIPEAPRCSQAATLGPVKSFPGISWYFLETLYALVTHGGLMTLLRELDTHSYSAELISVDSAPAIILS